MMALPLTSSSASLDAIHQVTSFGGESRWDRWDTDLEKAPALFPNFGLSNVGSGSTRIVMGNLVTSGLQRNDLRGLVEENIEQKLWAFSIPQNVVKAAIFFFPPLEWRQHRVFGPASMKTYGLGGFEGDFSS